MSDTAAFLAGCAVTGVAALFLVRGDFAIGETRPPQVLQPTPSLQTPSPGTLEDTGRGWRLQSDLEQQQNLSRDLTAQVKQQQDQSNDLRGQLEKQQGQTEDLKEQLEKQQRNTEQLIAQLQEQQRVMDKMAAAQQSGSLRSFEQSGTMQTIAIAVGAVLLIVVLGGGAIVIVTILVVVMMSRRKQTRTVHVMHPVPPSYGLPEPQLLPARTSRPRQPRHIDVDFYGE